MGTVWNARRIAETCFKLRSHCLECVLTANGVVQVVAARRRTREEARPIPGASPIAEVDHQR